MAAHKEIDQSRDYFPSWAVINKEEEGFDPADYRMYMTEIQLQQIVKQQKISGDGSSELDMTTVNGKRVSKWSLDAITFGKAVSEDLKARILEFSRKYVGDDKVFPTKNGLPKILTQFLHKPYSFELQPEYTQGRKPKPLPSVRATYYHGKPATMRVLEHFVRTTPVVSKCDNPRCLSRLVIVPKRDPGAPKTADPTSCRAAMNALINTALKPTASTLPLATDEIKKLHHYRYFLQADAANAFWSIPLDAESRRLTAFQTREGVFAWDRLTMGTKPASTVQQMAYHRAMDEHLPANIRHRFASYADDLACGADTLEELYEMYKALIVCLSKAGIQVKAAKVKFGMEEISFHNYTISKDYTRPKDENLIPIRNCKAPTCVTELKAFLGCTQQMSQYCQHYGLIAQPLHRLTRASEPFPKPWLEGTDYDIAFHRIKTMMLDGSRFLWNKDSSKRLFIEVDACNEGWGCCVYQYADDPPEDTEDEGRFRLHSKQPKRVVAWASKAWTDYERQLPAFYREALGRLLCLEHFRNLIETQQYEAGTTVYTDHAPSTYVNSLSNKGRLSTWKIHETSDLIAAVQTLYKAGEHLGPPHGLADPLSRLPRGETLHRLQLPALLKILLQHLPDKVRELHSMRVNAEKDTTIAARIVQKWRIPTNPVSTLRDTAGRPDFLIFASYADKVTHQIAHHIRNDQPFAALVPVDLLHEIDRDKNGKIDETVKTKREKMSTVLIPSLNLLWLISWPGYKIQGNCKVLLSAPEKQGLDRVDSSEGFDMLAMESLNELIANYAFTRSKAKAAQVRGNSTAQQAPTATPPPRAQKCNRHKHPSALDPLSFSSSPLPDPITKWIGKQSTVVVPTEYTVVARAPGKPAGLLHVKDDQGRMRIIVPAEQVERLVKQEHQVLLHVGANRIWHSLSRNYYWPKMKDDIIKFCTGCPDCQKARVRRQTLHQELKQASANKLPLPRQQYGIDFYGHAQGEILVAIDLCTREVLLWFLKDRKQDTVARALLTGLIFKKGVPMTFRSDEAAEFVGGVVAAMNSYLGIEQITTGGYNPRANAVAERFMATLGHMLRVCSDTEYRNIKDYLQCIAFAHNCTFNSQIEATPFEIGHGLPARTVTDARMAIPTLSIASEEGVPVQLHDKWEKGIHKKILELSTRLTTVAQAHSQWHRRMTAQKLNQAGKTIDESKLQVGMDVYFYRPPSQNQVLEKERKKKHLYHYHGPARIVRKLRDRQYEISYTDPSTGKISPFKRDASMLVPAIQYRAISVDFDPTQVQVLREPRAYEQGQILQEGEMIICRDHPSSQEWRLAEIRRILPRQIEVHYHSTYTPALDNYSAQDPTSRASRLSAARFRRTWYIRSGVHRGRATTKPPYPRNPDLRVWKGPLLDSELSRCILLRNVQVSPEGQLSAESIALAQKLPIPHAVIKAVEDEAAPAEEATIPPLFMFSQQPLCTCASCSRCLAQKRSSASSASKRPRRQEGGRGSSRKRSKAAAL